MTSLTEPELLALEALYKAYEAHKNDAYSYSEREILEVRDYQDAACEVLPRVLQELRDARERMRKMEAALEIIFDTAEEHMRNWECENDEHKDWFTIEAECRAVKQDLAREQEKSKP